MRGPVTPCLHWATETVRSPWSSTGNGGAKLSYLVPSSQVTPFDDTGRAVPGAPRLSLGAGRPVGAGRDPVAAPEPAGEVRLVGEPGRRGGIGEGRAAGQGLAGRPQPQQALVIAGRQAVTTAEGAVGHVPAAACGRGQVGERGIRGAAVVQEGADPVSGGRLIPGGQP